MELWIRSQDKMKLTRVIDIGIFEEQEGYTIYYDYDIDNMLGTYATKERALEVLDEIQKLIKPQLLVRRNDDNEKVLLGALQKGVTQKLDMEFKKLSTYVYEMPKE